MPLIAAYCATLSRGDLLEGFIMIYNVRGVHDSFIMHSYNYSNTLPTFFERKKFHFLMLLLFINFSEFESTKKMELA